MGWGPRRWVFTPVKACSGQELTSFWLEPKKHQKTWLKEVKHQVLLGLPDLPGVGNHHRKTWRVHQNSGATGKRQMAQGWLTFAILYICLPLCLHVSRN